MVCNTVFNCVYPYPLVVNRNNGGANDGGDGGDGAAGAGGDGGAGAGGDGGAGGGHHVIEVCV